MANDGWTEDGFQCYCEESDRACYGEPGCSAKEALEYLENMGLAYCDRNAYANGDNAWDTTVEGNREAKEILGSK